ncbi:MAG: hypothetical protein EHM20_17175, partial [Alphaproteobacteria bacterium]
MAETRFSDADSQKFLSGAKGVVSKMANERQGKQKADLQTIKPVAFDMLQSFVATGKISPEEQYQIKRSYEILAKDQSIKSEQVEAVLNKFIKDQFDEINRKPLRKLKEGMVCNNWIC